MRNSPLIVVGSVDDSAWLLQPEIKFNPTWMNRSRCYRCHNYLSERGYTYFGAYCSYTCAGRERPSADARKWPRAHAFGAKPKSYLRGPDDPRVKVLNQSGGKVLYFDPYCGFWHVGTRHHKGGYDNA